MVFKLSLRREAEPDLADAFEYYQSCRSGLGLEFMLCVEAALDSIQRNQLTIRRYIKLWRAILFAAFHLGFIFNIAGCNCCVGGIARPTQSSRLAEKNLIRSA